MMLLYLRQNSKFPRAPGAKDDELQVRIPENILPEGFLFADYGLFVEQAASPFDLVADSVQEDAIFNIVRTPVPAVSLADFGQNKDDTMTLTLLDQNENPIQRLVPDPVNGGTTFRTERWRIPFGEGSEERFVVTAWFNPAELSQVAEEPYFVEVKCVNPGSDNDCTYGISAAGTELGDDKNTDTFKSFSRQAGERCHQALLSCRQVPADHFLSHG